MLRFIATAVATFALVFSFAPSAEANRWKVGEKYPDVCKNIKGYQPIYMTVGTGPYRRTGPGTCRIGRF